MWRAIKRAPVVKIIVLEHCCSTYLDYVCAPFSGLAAPLLSRFLWKAWSKKSWNSKLGIYKLLLSNFHIDPHCVITPSAVYSAVLSQAVVAFNTVIVSLAQMEWLVCLKCCAWSILFKTQPVRSKEAGILAKKSVTGRAHSQGSISLPMLNYSR